jgi:prepilin-type N-terminal cleavage/methylation domain-containing protein
MRRTVVTRSPQGFTLVELLVVIAIIGVLVALLLPAVQAAREAARRSQCINNLKQLGIACQLHVDAYKFLPTAGWGDWWVGCPDQGAGKNQPGSWAYQLLPFIEESARRGIGQGFKCGDPNSRAAIGKMVGTPVSLFYCPSRRPVQGYPWINGSNVNFDPPELAAKSDYAGSVGDLGPEFIALGSDVGPSSLAAAETYKWRYSGEILVNIVRNRFGDSSSTGQTGVIIQHTEIQYRQITDGLSNTYLLGEKNLNPDFYVNGLAGNDDQSMYNGFDRDNIRSSFTWVPGTEDKVPPRLIPRPDTPGVDVTWVFGGSHVGGWAALFCVGSVHFLPYEMDPIIHSRLGNREDGNSIDTAGL